MKEKLRKSASTIPLYLQYLYVSLNISLSLSCIISVSYFFPPVQGISILKFSRLTWLLTISESIQHIQLSGMPSYFVSNYYKYCSHLFLTILNTVHTVTIASTSHLVLNCLCIVVHSDTWWLRYLFTWLQLDSNPQPLSS